MSEEPSVPVLAHDPHEAHVSPPSYWPIVTAFGLALALGGIIIYPAVWVAGIVITVVAIAGWLRDVGHDLSTAPTEPE